MHRYERASVLDFDSFGTIPMIKCGNCGNLNSPGKPFLPVLRFQVRRCYPPPPQRQESPSPAPFDYSAPFGYARVKTDEFTTSTEARSIIDGTAPIGQMGNTTPISGYQPQSLMHQGGQQFSQPYRCPHW